MTPAENTDKADSSRQLLATLWERGLPLLRERLAQLDGAAKASKLTPELRAEAASTAHKLAGSLGMFGYPEGTRVARTLEIQLEEGAGPPTLRPLAAKLRKSLSL